MLNLKNLVGACCVTLASGAGLTATLPTIPMQGGMAMPMVAYDARQGRLRVMMPADVPQLTPLLVSNPGDQFDPADPWYDDLDPSRKGLSFSRRYGFVMDAMSDPLPANTAIWLRKLSGSPELSFYRYAGSAPKTWQPIFGTADSPVALEWNGMMFHPAVTAPAGTRECHATFEAFLADKTTGAEIDGSVSGPLSFPFTNAPDGRPLLDIAAKVVIAWPADATGCVLEQADTLPAANWVTVPATPVSIEGKPTVLIEPSAATKFFRLRRVP